MAVKNDPSNSGGTNGRRWAWLGVAGVVALALVLFGATIWTSQGGAAPLAGATGAGMTTSSPTPTAAPTADPPAPSASAADPSAAPPTEAPAEPAPAEEPAADPAAVEPPPPAELPPVDLTEQVAPVPGVVFSIGDLEAVEGEAQGPGEVGGPALRFTLTMRNDGDSAVSLTSTVVNVYSGSEQLPAVDLQEPGGVPLPEEVAAGATVTGVFVFAVPVDQRDQVKIGVDYTVGVPIVVFEGAAPR